MMIHMVFQEIRMFKRMWLALLLAVSGLAYAQPSIEAVTGSLQGGGEVVKIDLSQALDALPTGFAIQSPARIALDFPGVANSMGRSTVEVNQGNLAIDQRRAGRRPYACRAEPQAACGLQGRVARQVRAGGVGSCQSRLARLP